MTSFRPDLARRPACMQRLGLLPPYSVDDVKKAYRALAKSAHPDAGGDAERFASLHRDYEHALSLASFHESRRKWLGERVERYAERSQLIETVEQLGGTCVLQNPDACVQDFGPDYAAVLCELVSIHLTGPAATDAVIERLLTSAAFSEVKLLDVSRSSVSDKGIALLAESHLQGLDVRRTAITRRSAAAFARMRQLEWLHVGKTRIGLWTRWRLQRLCPQLEIATDRHAEPPDFDSPGYRQLKLMQRLVNVGHDAGD